MTDTYRPDLRIEALDRSVRVSLSQGGTETSEVIVERAKVFEAFLSGK